MKLTQRDKVVLGVLAILLTLFLGIWFVIRPAFQEVQNSKQEYNTLRSEYQTKQEQLAKAEEMKSEVQTRYDECLKLQSNFYDRQPSFDVAEDIYNLLNECGITGTSATITESAKSLIAYSYDGGSSVSIPLDEYASVNDLTASAEDAIGADVAITANQTVGCYSFTIGFDHMTKEKIFNFVEKLREGNGDEQKTLVVTNLSFNITEAEQDGGCSGDIALEMYYMNAPDKPIVD